MLHAYPGTKLVLVTVGAVVCCLDIGFRHITAVLTGKYMQDKLYIKPLFSSCSQTSLGLATLLVYCIVVPFLILYLLFHVLYWCLRLLDTV